MKSRSFVLGIAFCLVTGCDGGKLTNVKALSLLNRQRDFEVGRTRTASLHTEVWVPQEPTATRSQSLAIKNFFEALRREDLLTSPATRPLNKLSSPGTEFSYLPKPGPEVISASNVPELTIVMARGVFWELTGLTGEGDAYQAEVQIEVRPTDTYKRVRTSLEKLKAAFDIDRSSVIKRALEDQGPPKTQHDLHFWPWPSDADLTFTQTAKFQFRRSGDGWRVERPSAERAGGGQ